jgi:AcrR family transcriptional regulator
MLTIRSKSDRIDARRVVIVDSAIRAMNDRGLRGAGMRDIARAAGLSTGNLYYYFRGKEELVYACQDRAVDRLLDVLAGAKDRPDSYERLAAIIDGHLRVVMDGGASLHLELDALPKPLLKKLVAKRDQYERGVREVIIQGQREGAIRPGDPKLQAFALLGSVNWVARWYREGESDREELIASFCQQLLKGLLWQRS